MAVLTGFGKVAVLVSTMAVSSVDSMADDLACNLVAPKVGCLVDGMVVPSDILRVHKLVVRLAGAMVDMRAAKRDAMTDEKTADELVAQLDKTAAVK